MYAFTNVWVSIPIEWYERALFFNTCNALSYRSVTIGLSLGFSRQEIWMKYCPSFQLKFPFIHPYHHAFTRLIMNVHGSCRYDVTEWWLIGLSLGFNRQEIWMNYCPSFQVKFLLVHPYHHAFGRLIINVHGTCRYDRNEFFGDVASNLAVFVTFSSWKNLFVPIFPFSNLFA